VVCGNNKWAAVAPAAAAVLCLRAAAEVACFCPVLSLDIVLEFSWAKALRRRRLSAWLPLLRASCFPALSSMGESLSISDRRRWRLRRHSLYEGVATDGGGRVEDQGFGSLAGEESELSRVGCLVAWQRRRATFFMLVTCVELGNDDSGYALCVGLLLSGLSVHPV
jgi:hypothetical protein